MYVCMYVCISIARLLTFLKVSRSYSFGQPLIQHWEPSYVVVPRDIPHLSVLVLESRNIYLENVTTECTFNKCFNFQERRRRRRNDLREQEQKEEDKLEVQTWYVNFLHFGVLR